MYLKLIGLTVEHTPDDTTHTQKVCRSVLRAKDKQLETLFKYFKSIEKELSKTGDTRLLLWHEP